MDGFNIDKIKDEGKFVEEQADLFSKLKIEEEYDKSIIENLVEEEDISSDKKRSFKVVVGEIKFNGCVGNDEEIKEGRYLGKSPLQAAKKAFTQICRIKKIKPKDMCEIIFAIKETTRDSKTQGKIFRYKGVRTRENPPKKITKISDMNNIKSYQIDFRDSITSYKV